MMLKKNLLQRCIDLLALSSVVLLVVLQPRDVLVSAAAGRRATAAFIIIPGDNGKASSSSSSSTSFLQRKNAFGTVQQQARVDQRTRRNSSSSATTTSSRLFAATTTTTTSRSSSNTKIGTGKRRKELLTRKGPYFKLNKQSGKIEFGATANLLTQLEPDDEPNFELICDWLRDEKGLALSIWDESMTTDKGNSVYRLSVMPLQFVTLKVNPWVDMEMKTLMGKSNGKPIFCLQSINFDPNIELLPGVKFDSKSLNIIIEVAGQLKPTNDGKGVIGAIAFQTTGTLSPPLRLLPDAALQAASDTINDTVVQFAVKSFQKGAKAKYKEAKQGLLLKQQQQQQQEQKQQEHED